MLIVLLVAPCILALAAFVFWDAIKWWQFEWTKNGTYYAHGVFIPFFVAAMLWRDRERILRVPLSRCWWGLIPVALSILLVVYSHKAEVDSVLSVSFMLFLFGAVMIVGGKAFTKVVGFPVAFLLTMIPIFPNQVVGIAAFPIQMASAKLAATCLNVLGFDSVRVGTQILMEHYRFNVEAACSGFKTLLGLMSFAGAFAYLVEGAVFKRWILFLVSAPLAVIINGVRIMLVGLVGELVSTPAAEVFHDYSGFIVLILGFMVLFSMAKWLKCDSFFGMPLQDAPKGTSAPVAASEPTEGDLSAKYGRKRLGSAAMAAPGLIAIVVLLAGGAIAKALSPPPVSQPHLIMQPTEVPVVLANGAWKRLGDSDIPITKIVQKTLEPDTYLDRNYLGSPPKGGLINLFISGGASRHTFHDPHDCFTGSGYALRDLRVESVKTDVGTVKVQVSEATELKSKVKSLLMFVFIVDGDLIHQISSVHLRLFAQTFTGSSGRPFYFVRFRQLAEGMEPERVEEMRDFIKAVWPTLAPKMMSEKSLTKLAAE